MAVHTSRSRSRSATRRHARRAAACETLESRFLLSTITWSNRGSATNDSDRFNAVFGTLANQARAVVDADIAYWQRVITNFNYSNGTNTFTLSISMNSSALTTPGNGVGANATGTATIGTNPAKPSAATIGIGWRSGVTAGTNSAAGWYLDPTPMDNSEFTLTQNAFTANPTSLPGGDMLTCVMHEIGHAVGLGSGSVINAFATDTGFTDNVNTPASSPAAHLYRVDTPNSHTLWTAWDSGGATGGASNRNGAQHYAPLGTNVTQNGRTYFGAVALMNAYFSNRSVIDDGSANLLQDAYGYFIQPPSYFGTFYDHLDADGTLTIQPPATSGGQTLDLTVLNGNLQVTLNIANPVGGIDPSHILSGFPLSSISKINITMGAGNDVITMSPTAAAIPMSINMGGGTNDVLTVFGGSSYDPLTIDNANNGLGGRRLVAAGFNLTNLYNIETLNFYTGGGGLDAYLPNVSGISSINIFGTSSAENMAFHSLGSGSALNVNGGTGANTFTLDLGIINTAGSDVDVVGGGGTDRIVFDASTAGVGIVFNVFDGLITTQPPGSQRWMYYENIRSIDVYSGSGADYMQVYTLGSTQSLRYFSGDGNDHMDVGYTEADGVTGTSWSGDVAGSVTFSAQGGSDDSITVNDTVLDSGAPATYTLTNGLLATPLLHNLNFDSLCENFEFYGRSYGNSVFTVLNYNPTQHLRLHGGVNSPTADFLYIDDRTMSGPPSNPSSVEVYPNQIKRFFSYIPTQPNLIDYDNWTSPTYYGNTANPNNIYVYGVSNQIPDGYQMTILGGDNADNVRLYPHDASSNLTVNGNLGIGGGAGYDTMYVIDDNNPNGINYQFANTFGAGTQNIYGMGSHGIGFGADFEDLFMNAGNGNDNFRVDSYLVPTRMTISGRSGNDTVDYAMTTRNLATAIRNGVTMSFNGGGGSGVDRVTVWNDLNASAWTYERSNGVLLVNRNDGQSGSAHFALNIFDANVGNVVVRGGSAADTFAVNAPISQPIEIHGNAGLDSVNVTSGRATFAESEDLSTLAVFDGAQAAVTGPASASIYVTSLVLLGTGTMDLSQSDMIVDYTGSSQLTSVQTMIARARNNGTWTGSGLTSTAARDNPQRNTALGAIEASEFKSLPGNASAPFGGRAIDTTSVLIKYTYYGDANFDGRVTFDDYTRIDTGFAQRRTGWFNGDFNLSGSVTFDDYVLIDTAFNSQGATLGRVGSRGDVRGSAGIRV